MPKTKILYAIGTMQLGGAEKHLVDVLKNINRKKYEPSLICLSQGGPLIKEVKKTKVHIKILGLRAKRKNFIFKTIKAIIAINKLKRIMRREKPDIFHGYLFHSYFLGAIAAKLAGVPMIITSRRQCAELERTLFLSSNKLTNPFIDIIICNSNAVKKTTVKTEHVSPKKTKVIYNGKNLRDFDIKVDITKKKKELGLAGGPVVGMVANFIWYKGHEHFLKAAKKILEKIPDAQFVLVGDGPEKEKLKKMSKELKIEKNVHFLGSRKNVLDVISLFDVSVLTSFSEGFSNVILEYMAMKKPVIATNVGGNPEAIIEGKTGFLVPAKNSKILTDRIVGLLKNPRLAKKMGEEGRKTVEKKFNIKKMIREMEKTYDLLMEK